MKKLNSVVYHKLLLQAEEAKQQGMHKLAAGIMSAIDESPATEVVEYSQAQLNEDIHCGLWKLAKNIMVFYDSQSVDAEKLDETIVLWASKFVDDMEHSLGTESIIRGPLEPIVPGETK